MTLLSRGITSSRQGLSYLDRAIAKAEANDQELKSNVNLYNDTLEGFKSSSTYLGTRSRNILNEYSKAFESAVDMYAADPSEENQQRVDNIKLQTQDFYNRAVAARQNSLNQLNTFKANQFDYNFSLEEAMQEFSQAEDTNVSARFDMNSMEMLVGEGESQQTIGNVGYYNGNEPLYYSKRSSLGTAVAEGYWATQNYDTFASVIGTEDGKEKIVDAYKSKARFSESDQMTAIFNYVQDKKGVDLSKIKNNEELLMHINAVRNDGAELDKAFSHMAELEYNWMVGAKAAKALEAQAKTFNETYSGQILSRGERPSEEGPLYTRVEGVEGEMYKDPYNGLAEVRQLVTPIKVTDESAGISGLSQYGDVLTGYDVDALGNIVITVDKVEQDPEDEEKSIIKRGQIHVLEPGSGDLYTNLQNDLVRKGLFSVLQRQSMARQASHQQKVNDERLALAYANSGEEAPLPELRIDITAKDIEAAMTPPTREEAKTEEELDFRGGKEIISAPRGYKEDQVVALNEKFVNNLRQKGYTEQEIKDGIREMQKQNISFEASPFTNFFKNIGVAFREGRNVFEVFDGGMKNATKEFEKVLIGLNPAYREKYGTGPNQPRDDEEARLESKRLFGRNFREGREEADGNIVSKESLLGNLSEEARKDYEAGGGVAVLTNNPGNLRPYEGYEGPVYYNRGDESDQFRVFDTPQEGLAALERDVEVKVGGGGVVGDRIKERTLPSGATSAEELTIFDIISVYAPNSENDPERYSEAIASFAKSKGYDGVTADSPASSIPIEVLVEAIIKVESGQNHRRLTAQGLFDEASDQTARG